jgi:hypothetical protein
MPAPAHMSILAGSLDDKVKERMEVTSKQNPVLFVEPRGLNDVWADIKTTYACILRKVKARYICTAGAVTTRDTYSRSISNPRCH